MNATVVASLLALLAACGTPSGASPPNDKQPPPDVDEDQHFCCFSIDVSGKGTGEGCVAIDKVNINSCDKVLYCDGGWGKDEGKVTCL